MTPELAEFFALADAYQVAATEQREVPFTEAFELAEYAVWYLGRLRVAIIESGRYSMTEGGE